MKLRPALYSFIVEDLKQLARLCGGPCPDGARKEQLVEYIAGRLTDPVALEEVWRRLDPLSRKAVATAYHAGGEFAPEAFVAQYGELPGQMAGLSLQPVRGVDLLPHKSPRRLSLRPGRRVRVSSTARRPALQHRLRTRPHLRRSLHAHL